MRSTFYTENKAHIWQTGIILLPVLSSIILVYISIRTDLSKALDDNVRQDQTILEMRRDDKEYSSENRRLWSELKDIMAKVQQDVAVSNALRGGKK